MKSQLFLRSSVMVNVARTASMSPESSSSPRVAAVTVVNSTSTPRYSAIISARLSSRPLYSPVRVSWKLKPCTAFLTPTLRTPRSTMAWVSGPKLAAAALEAPAVLAAVEAVEAAVLLEEPPQAASMERTAAEPAALTKLRREIFFIIIHSSMFFAAWAAFPARPETGCVLSTTAAHHNLCTRPCQPK